MALQYLTYYCLFATFYEGFLNSGVFGLGSTGFFGIANEGKQFI